MSSRRLSFLRSFLKAFLVHLFTLHTVACDVSYMASGRILWPKVDVQLRSQFLWEAVGTCVSQVLDIFYSYSVTASNVHMT